MSFDTFTQVMLLLIFASFVVERSLAVVYETDVYISRFGDKKYLKPTIAILYAAAFVWIADINLVELINLGAKKAPTGIGYHWDTLSTDVKNILIIVVTGVFVAGGSKASLKLFRDVLNIKSSAEARRAQGSVAVPVDPAGSSVAAAKGNKESKQLSYDFLDTFKQGSKL